MRRIIQAFNRYLFYLAAVPLFVMMIITDIDVSGRYFRHPLPGTLELGTICLGLICTWCWANTQARRGHISIDLLLKVLPRRVQAVTNIITSAIALGITGLIAWQAVPWVMLSQRLMDWTDVLKLPVWPFKAMMFLGTFCLALQLLLDLIDNIRELGKRQAAATVTAPQGPGGTGID